MHKLVYAFAIVAVSGLTSFAASSSATPITGGLALNGAVPIMDSDGLVQKVHGWHCRKRYGWYHGHKYWHRHRRACDDYDYRYSPGYATPFFGFYFDNDGRRHRRKHKHGDND
jgi:hypothetical protein